MFVTEFSQEGYYYNQKLFKYHYLVLLFESTSYILSQAFVPALQCA